MDREKIMNSTVPKEIFERKKIEGKLEEKLDKVEGMMKQLNMELKAQKKKSEDDYKEEIDRLESSLGQIKAQLATTVYEKESMGAKYRRYIEKLKKKLISLGFKFKDNKK